MTSRLETLKFQFKFACLGSLQTLKVEMTHFKIFLIFRNVGIPEEI